MIYQEQTLSDPVLSQYTDVFDGVGELSGEYTIQILPDAMPIVNPHADYQWHCEVWSKPNWMQWQTSKLLLQS